MRLLLLLIILFISGCTTALWSPTYKEELVDGFYVKSDTNELFVTSSQSAYLFEIDEMFGEALILSREINFLPSFNDFTLNKDNTIEGIVSLTLLNEQPSSAVEARLLALGFERDELLKKLKLTKKVKGKRYVVEGFLPLEKLEKSQPIAVAQPSTFIEAAGKIIATPATIAIDSVVVVPAVFVGATVMAAGGGE